MITKITCQEEVRHITPFSIETNGKSVIFAGDNGCGKSTLLNGIATICYKIKKKRLFFESNDNLTHAFQVDIDENKVTDVVTYFQSDNFKTKSFFDGDIATHIQGLHHSSGESLFVQILRLVRNTSNGSIFFLDEPDGGLSYFNQKLLSAMFAKKAIAEGNQFFIASHNEKIWDLAENFPDNFLLFNMETKEITTKEKLIAYYDAKLADFFKNKIATENRK